MNKVSWNRWVVNGWENGITGCLERSILRDTYSRPGRPRVFIAVSIFMTFWWLSVLPAVYRGSPAIVIFELIMHGPILFGRVMCTTVDVDAPAPLGIITPFMWFLCPVHLGCASASMQGIRAVNKRDKNAWGAIDVGLGQILFGIKIRSSDSKLWIISVIIVILFWK